MERRFRTGLSFRTTGLVLGLVSLLLVSAATADAASPADFKLKDLKGETFQLSDHLGEEVIYISFWATWCVPCRREMPHLQELYEELKGEGFTVLSVNTDPAANKSKIKPWVNRYKITFPIVLDPDNTVHDRFNPPRKLPYGVLIARDGSIQETYPGYRTGDELRLKEAVRELLASGGETDGQVEENDG